ncbi:molybdopterin-dependent oxidoreductase [Mesorhizobium sp. VK9D]|uniref:molybdopterin-dependent oxidoreductase n=1 Tax=Mesorhizobium australafricanum TaxID=3072311 RepID=UPI002A24DC72|nr:molybdopterin-dependent oxidoreductase [Mesorhizobium sp. VK9D]MDX8452331.1 molybdopterin-dependent oxidoreductase [Mesorhizobium sp. VK9D]
MSDLSATHWGFAHVDVEDGRVARLRPFEKDANASPIQDGVAEAVYAATRVGRPHVRKGWLEGRRDGRGGDAFVPVDWETAYDHVERALRQALDNGGNEAIFAGSYGWGSAGRFHHAATHLKRFLNTIGGFVDQKQTYSFAAGQIICPHVVGDNRILFGGETTVWPAIIENARLILFFGGINLTNAQVSAGGLGNHATPDWVSKALQRGIRIISITPKRDADPRLAGVEWLPLRPGSDVALILALAHTIADEGRLDRDFIDRCTSGYDRFEPYLLGQSDGVPKDAAWASHQTGIEPQIILDLARALAESPSFLTASWSMQRQENGEQPLWMLIVLSAMLGEIGRPGGGVSFGYGSVGNRGEPRPLVSSPSFSAGKNPLGRFIPVARVADMLLHPGETIRFDDLDLVYPRIDLVWWAGGNPFHHHQDLNRLVEAFQKPSTIIVNEIWWTATARHADIVLPATTSLERNDLSGSPTDRFSAAMRRQIDPVGEARSEFDIFLPLAARFGTEALYAEGLDEMGWIRRIYEDFRTRAVGVGAELPEFDAFWEKGYVELPVPERHYTLFEDFRRDPERHPLATASGKIEIWSSFIEQAGHADVHPHPRWVEPVEWLGTAEAGQLHLVSPQPSTRLHSQLDGVGVSRRSKVAGREPVLINPIDAAARGIADGDVVLIRNARGRCLAGAKLSEDIMPGVLSLPTGAWYSPVEPGKASSLDLHGNPNMLTTNRPTSSLSQAPAQHSALVFLSKANIYDQPQIHRGGPGAPQGQTNVV